MTPQEITTLVNTVAVLNANMVTTMDVVKVVGAFMGGLVSFFSALTFFWMRHLKNEMREDRKLAKEEMDAARQLAKEDMESARKANKEAMRQMFKDMHAGFEEKYLLKLSNICNRVDKLEDWYLTHYKSYHSKSGV